MTDLAGIIERDREWGEATPSPDAVIWTRHQLAEAYLLAGVDRRALLGLLRETREALAIIAAPEPPGTAYSQSVVVIRRQNIAQVALKPLAALAEP